MSEVTGYRPFELFVVRPRMSRSPDEVPQLFIFLSIEWNSVRLAGPAHGMVTKTVYKILSRDGGDEGV